MHNDRLERTHQQHRATEVRESAARLGLLLDDGQENDDTEGVRVGISILPARRLMDRKVRSPIA